MLYTNIILFISSLCYQLNQFYCYDVVFSDGQYFEGDNCNRQIDDASGECKPIHHCPKAQQTYRQYGIKPDVCEFKYDMPIVCCSEANLYYEQKDPSPNGISFKKCREYENIPNQNVQQSTQSNNNLQHLAAIGWTTIHNIVWKCDGSLISKNFVISSAGCIASKNVIPDIVKFMAQDQLKGLYTENLEYFRITEIVNHPEYKQKSFYDDIVLLRLNRNVRFGRNIHPACLWPTYNINSTTLLFSKWNHNSHGVIQQYRNIFDLNQCAQYYEPLENLKFGISYNQICTYDYYTTNNNNCRNNPGGTLQVSFTTRFRNQFYLVGIGTFEMACANGSPEVYTRVSSYIEWIEKIVWPNNN